jgi:hypothetical protein
VCNAALEAAGQCQVDSGNSFTLRFEHITYSPSFEPLTAEA